MELLRNPVLFGNCEFEFHLIRETDIFLRDLFNPTKPVNNTYLSKYLYLLDYAATANENSPVQNFKVLLDVLYLVVGWTKWDHNSSGICVFCMPAEFVWFRVSGLGRFAQEQNNVSWLLLSWPQVFPLCRWVFFIGLEKICWILTIIKRVTTHHVFLHYFSFSDMSPTIILFKGVRFSNCWFKYLKWIHLWIL